jgi:quercetin dioxygenase-like cupin family protein
VSHIRLVESAHRLPKTWSSSVLAKFGDANLKLVRMDERAYPEECHDYAEGLLVLDGEMRLQLGAEVISVQAGEIYIVPAGVAHSVAAGSKGTLLILDV